jgi:hypothetical protein
METLDKQKLLGCLRKEFEHCKKMKFNKDTKSHFYVGRESVLLDIITKVESGAFDIQEEQTRSTLQNGDKVTHTKHKYLGTGIIIQFSKTGKTATVDFSQINDWDNKRFPSPPRSFNYLVEHLILVEEQTDEKS